LRDGRVDVRSPHDGSATFAPIDPIGRIDPDQRGIGRSDGLSSQATAPMLAAVETVREAPAAVVC
jgi:hypothetical protein